MTSRTHDTVAPTSDPHHASLPGASWLDPLAARLVKDPRDVVFARVSIQLTAILVPSAVILFLLPTWATLALAPLYWAMVYGGYAGPYMLMQHAVMHRPIAPKRGTGLDLYIPWVLGPFFGSTPTSFSVHHLGMHHIADNGPADASSTLQYRRDHLPHFLHYWARFFFFGYLHLGRYLWLRGRTKMLRRFFLGEAAWAALVVVAARIDLAGALVVLVGPFCILRFLMMSGNWSQHAFLSMEAPRDGWRNATCLTDARYNHFCYNDGYHIVHHLRPGMHWSEMPAWFDKHRAKFAEKDAIVFSGLNNNQAVWWLLMTQDYGRLADHLVDFRGRTRDEKIAFLKDRVRTVGAPWKGFLTVESAADAAAESAAKAPPAVARPAAAVAPPEGELAVLPGVVPVDVDDSPDDEPEAAAS